MFIFSRVQLAAPGSSESAHILAGADSARVLAVKLVLHPLIPDSPAIPLGSEVVVWPPELQVRQKQGDNAQIWHRLLSAASRKESRSSSK